MQILWAEMVYKIFVSANFAGGDSIYTVCQCKFCGGKWYIDNVSVQILRGELYIGPVRLQIAGGPYVRRDRLGTSSV